MVQCRVSALMIVPFAMANPDPVGPAHLVTDGVTNCDCHYPEIGVCRQPVVLQFAGQGLSVELQRLVNKTYVLFTRLL